MACRGPSRQASNANRVNRSASYGAAVAASTVDSLLTELEDGVVMPEQVVRRSLASRLSQLATTTVLAAVAILGSILLCELTRKR